MGTQPSSASLARILCLCLVLLFTSAFACVVRGQEVPIEGTTLRVVLPPDWEKTQGPGKLGDLGHVLLRRKGESGFLITLAQNAKSPLVAPMHLPFECDVMFGVLSSKKDANGKPVGVSSPRPDYIPDEYY